MSYAGRDTACSGTRAAWGRFTQLVLLGALGCAPGVPGAPLLGALQSPIRTNQLSYVIAPTGPLQRPGFTLIATYRNDSAERRILDTCDKRPPLWHLEKKTSEGWVRAYEPACTLVAPETPPTLAPGATRIDTLVVIDHRPNLPRFSVEAVPGTYRLVYSVFAEESGAPSARLLPLDQRTSNEFEIREPGR